MTHIEKMRLQAALKALQGIKHAFLVARAGTTTLSLVSCAEDEQAAAGTE